MMKITVWSIVSENGNIKHNHIEDGYAEGDYPKPINKEFSNQKAWENLKWLKEYANLIDGKVVRI